MSKESQVQNLVTIGTEEAATHFDATASQDKESYDGDVSEENEEDAQVISDKAYGVLIKTLKSAGADTLPDNEGQEANNEGDRDQTAKPKGKKPAQKCDNRSLPGS